MPSNKKLLQAAAGSAGGDPLYVEDVFSTYLWEGTNSANTIENGIDLAGEGGLVWSKWRSITNDHMLVDTERGALKVIKSNSTGAQVTNGNNAPSSFLSNGFTYTDNGSGYPIASWSFRKAEKFFDVVTYTGNGTAGRTVSHDLGSVPAVMLVKSTDVAGNWVVYHKDIGTTKYLYLNTTAAEGSFDFWNATAPTDTEFTLGGFGSNNASGGTFVAYLFASDAGGFGDDGDENIIKCGSVTTDGSGNASVDVGFEPQWCLWKCIDAAGGDEHGNWRVNDVMRGWPVPGASNAFGSPSSLYANTSGAETNNGVDGFIKSATGFGFGQVQANKTYIYIAIRRPMKTPESGTEVFAVDTADGTPLPQYESGFVTDFEFNRSVTDAAYTAISSRLTGNEYLRANDTDAGAPDNDIAWDYMDGWGSATWTLTGQYSWMFKRATGFMDVVCYTGTGSANTISHNLGVIPELLIGKDREDLGANWGVYCAYATIPTRSSALNTTAPFLSSTITNSQTPTATSVTVTGSINGGNQPNVIYLFATLAGVSKVGSYTGTGSNVDVDCGFSAGARFILIKRSDSAGDWYVWDSVRGITAGNDPYFLLNTTAAQVTNTDYIDPLSSGFTVTSSAPAALNASGSNYIFLAIA